MSENKTVITIITDVFSGDEYTEAPECAVIKLTQKKLDRIRHLSDVVTKEDAYVINEYACCDWFPNKPAYTFEELGDKFILLSAYPVQESYDFCEETVDDGDFSFERINTEMRNVRKGDFFHVGYGKYSGAKFESIAVPLKQIYEELAKPEPTPRERYYFPEGAEVPSFEDLPKYLNDGCPGLRMYAKEKLKEGGSNGYSLPQPGGD